MANPFQDHTEHSAAYFGDTRDHWWNRDFLELMARRWRLGAVRTVLDVGCGVGHWGQLLEAVLPQDATLVGVDREAAWVEAATERAREQNLTGRFSYQLASAERLPFADDTFDLTTCQTVLIHLPDPSAGLAEMIRVTRPGGLVMVAEPNNLTQSLLLDSITNQLGIDAILDLVRFQLTCERGKVALGEGDNSLGDRVPGLFAAAGLTEVQVFVNDKATAIVPPYRAEAERAALAEERDRAARGLWNWDEAETKRFFLAGGGALEAFAGHYARGLQARQNIVKGVDDNHYHGVMGGAFFLIAGRKPTAGEVASNRAAARAAT
jgi:SAM-dependent methyltransferase